MSSLPYQDIRDLCFRPDVSIENRFKNKPFIPMITPCYEKTVFEGMTYGLSQCGYDIRIAQDVTLYPITLKYLFLNAISRWTGKTYPHVSLASSIEHFNIPTNIRAKLCDKSSWIRKWLTVGNTVMEPGWSGFLTLELMNNGREIIQLKAGMPIGQMVFDYLSSPTKLPYDGKYQNQPNRPVNSILE